MRVHVSSITCMLLRLAAHEHQIETWLQRSIYKFPAAFFMWCSSLGIPWSCENTLRSYLWELLCWKQLIALPSAMFVDYACCM